jgi:hypothetical protein
MQKILPLLGLLLGLVSEAQNRITPFEQSQGLQTTTYFQCIDFYTHLAKTSQKMSIKQMGMSDAGYPYHIILYSNDGKFDPAEWHLQNKIVLLILNGIHPGEPDGVDASMLFLRDLTAGTIQIPNNVCLAVIPLYNIGGALNRNSFSRVNQNGPESFGFRGNAQNLDLNRDFTKCDSRNARSFAELFHWLEPDIQLDTHVSDGADYQHTMTLITTQWNKLGGELGQFVHDDFDPALYRSMKNKAWPMCPYVNFEEGNPQKGWIAFFDTPRYSSGYAALFHTISYISETHMLKPFAERVHSTYALFQCLVAEASAHQKSIIEKRKHDIQADRVKTTWALNWKPDSLRFDTILFKGYESAFKTSELTGQMRLYYDHGKPFEREVNFYDYFTEDKVVHSPRAYLIPQGWHEVIDLLQLNGVKFQRLQKDSIIVVQAYHIDQYKSTSRPYEKHHRNSGVEVSSTSQSVQFLKGDYLAFCNQPSNRFMVEMLEPTGDDSYFSWNFFDAILQQKEGYSDYRWEDIASSYVASHPELASLLKEKKNTDSAFARDASAQLEFVYRHSPYYEPAHMRYPVFRLL